MKILGLIPARGGSKRLPGKNIKLLGGVPLIGWTIRASLESGVLADVVVSTDDAEIAEISKSYGASVPGFRPPGLATDTALSVDVAIHALDQYEGACGSVDGLMLLQPTSPFRTAETIRRAAAKYQASGGRPLVGVSKTDVHPAWSFYIEDDVLDPVLGWDGIQHRSQDLRSAYVLNGAMYIAAPEMLRSERTFFTRETLPLIIFNQLEALDIDTEWDWQLAKALCPNCIGDDVG